VNRYELVAYAVHRLDAIPVEQRVRFTRMSGFPEPEALILTVACPDESTLLLLGALVEALGGGLSRVPSDRAASSANALGLPLVMVLPWDEAIEQGGLPSAGL